jgi:hypothetical protein
MELVGVSFSSTRQSGKTGQAVTDGNISKYKL